MRRLWICLAFVTGLVLAAGLQGCGGKPQEKKAVSTGTTAREEGGEKAAGPASESEAPKQGDKVDVDADTGNVKIEAGESEVSVGGNVEVPKNFPEDVPIYTGLKLNTSAQDKETATVRGVTSDSVEKVVDFYKSRLEAKGWTEDMVVSQGGKEPMTMLTYSKDDRSASIMIMRTDTETSVSITTPIG